MAGSNNMSATRLVTNTHLTAAEPVDAYHQLDVPSPAADDACSSMLITLPLAAGTVGAALAAVLLGGGSGGLPVAQVPFVLIAATGLILSVGTATRRLTIDAVASFWGYAAQALPVVVVLAFSLASHNNLVAFKEQEPAARNACRVTFFAGGMATGVLPRPLSWKVKVAACFEVGMAVASTVLTVRVGGSIGFLCKLFFHRAVPLLLGLTIAHYDSLLRAAKRHTNDLYQAAREAGTGSQPCVVPHEDQDDDACSSSSSYIARDGSHERLATLLAPA